MDRNLNSIMEILRASYPDKVLVDLDEYEDNNHQTYKYLYDAQSEKVTQQTEEIYNLQFQLQDRERELSQIRIELEKQKSVNEKLNSTTSNIMEFVKKFSEQDIIVADVKAMDANGKEIVSNSDQRVSLSETISEHPGVYGHKRPSWFTPLKNELNKNEAAKKSACNTKYLLKDRLLFWKKIDKERTEGKVSPEVLADQVDMQRKRNICELLTSDCSNEEKYLKYFLLTPGIPRDFLKTLLGASELGLDANVIIELLEQPVELYNREIIELYVSETHKGTEYNLKKELAKELVDGAWYVSAQINGEEQKLQLVPMELLNDLKDKLDNICSILADMADGEVYTVQAQTSPNPHQYEEEIPDYPSDVDTSPLIDFDESLLN